MFVPIPLPQGALSASMAALSSDGAVVVGTAVFDASHREAFRWSADAGLVLLGALPGDPLFSEAADVSADGSVVVGDSPSGVFRWTALGGMEPVAVSLPNGFTGASASSVSADGAELAGFLLDLNAQREPFLWSEVGGTALLDEDPLLGEARDVSDDASVVVGDSSVLGGAFRWTAAGGAQVLGDLPGGPVGGTAYAVSGDGSIVVGQGFGASGAEAFVWAESTGMLGLGDLAGGIFASAAFAVSADGSIVVGTGAPSAGGAAFVWDSTHGLRSLQEVLENELGLDLEGWTLTQARGISADGRVIGGWGTNPDGVIQSWVAVLPEPSPAWLLGAIVLARACVRPASRARVSQRSHAI